MLILELTTKGIYLNVKVKCHNQQVHVFYDLKFTMRLLCFHKISFVLLLLVQLIVCQTYLIAI